MNFGTVCSGIGAPETAWHPLGWKCSFQAEIEKFPSAVLKAHWPDVPNHGNLLIHKEWPEHAVRLICAGTPCQSFSVAGLRKGLADPRGNLTLAFLGVVARYSPRWVVWENVPGILSDRDNAFGSFLTGLAECGYGTAYRVLDAQYFGLAQRRKRVFVVGYFGDWRPAAAVLFERESLSWNPAPSREAWKRVAPSLAARTRGCGGLGTDAECDGALIAGTLSESGAGTQRTAGQANEADFCIPIQEIGKRQSGTPKNGTGYGNPGDVMFTLQSAAQHGVCHALKADGHDASEDGSGRGVPLIASAVSSKWAKGTGGPSGDEAQNLLPTLLSNGDNHSGFKDENGKVVMRYGVRRLTPIECERLMGLPDDYTLVEYRKKPAKDGPRYKALGNSIAVPVLNWIGHRIEMVEKLQAE